jgi:hypothetical protein
MKWYKYPFPLSGDYKACEIWLNDDNINPPWFDYRAPFTEFHVRRGSKTLLIVAGESWTYGENLKGKINSGLRYDLFTQLSYCWGPCIGTMLDIDVLQYARAGCSNLYITCELERLVKYAIDLKMYDQLLICYQMTDDSREFLHSYETWGDHPLKSILSIRGKINPRREFKDWLCEYDNVFFNIFDSIVDYATDKVSVDATLFRNLTKVSSNMIPKNFRIIPDTWIEYNSKIDGVNLTSPYTWTVAPDRLHNGNPRNITLSPDWALEQSKLVEASMNYITGATKLHTNHPTPLGHKVWAEHLVKESGWERFKR